VALEGAVDFGHIAQSERARLDHKIIDRDRTSVLVLEHRTESLNLLDINLDGDIEVRGLLLGLLCPLGDHLAEAIERDRFVLTLGEDGGADGGELGALLFDGPADILLNNAAPRASP